MVKTPSPWFVSTPWENVPSPQLIVAMNSLGVASGLLVFSRATVPVNG